MYLCLRVAGRPKYKVANNYGTRVFRFPHSNSPCSHCVTSNMAACCLLVSMTSLHPVYSDGVKVADRCLYSSVTYSD